ncbi:hypothetical protein HMN09_01152400 [Mycena chlorophos]|uniref:Uncharacterized protein n=1 Tax=Mycena chlorophos TaxID=658473 RepID=A0A8H6S8M9_MYCCL|nr:hypothetical protein HMN09_01152400 [Mycena chlorophos]
MSARRQRQCRTCHRPMKGHPIGNCPQSPSPESEQEEEQPQPPGRPQTRSYLATPPVSPPNPFDFNAAPVAGPSRLPPDVGLMGHWVNPGWPAPITPAAPHLVRAASNDSSLVPTVLVDSDGHTIQGPGSARPQHGYDAASESEIIEEDHDDAGMRLKWTSSKTPMAQMLDHAHALQLCDPVLSIMRVRAADLPRMQATAGQAGLCTSIVRSPWVAPKLFKEEEVEVSLNHWNLNLAHSSSPPELWLVVGADPGLVQRTADMQQQLERIPGSLREDVHAPTNYKQIFIASAVSAFVVLGGLGILF